jgi:hypothetical protein
MTHAATTLLTLLLVAPLPGRPSLSTHVSAGPRLTVGDRFDVTLVLENTTGALVTGPLADSTGAFVVAGETRHSVRRAGHSQLTCRLSMAGFRPGTHRLPAFTFLLATGPRTDTLRSEPAAVTIASVLPEKMSDVHALKPAERFPNVLLWIVPGALAALAALAWLGRRLYRRLRADIERVEAPLPPWEEAFRSLDGMPWREWLDAGHHKRYYYALSEILKRYIERRFEFQAAEQTTTEVLAAMRLHRTPMRDDIARFFLRSDLVKYSKVLPPEEEARGAIDQVREFVTRTRPVEPAPADPASAAGAGDARRAEGA